MGQRQGKDAEAEKPDQLAAAGEEQSSRQKPVRARNYRKAAQAEIERKYKDIVVTFAEKAAAGSVPHTKLLFDLGGVKDEVKAASKPRRRRPPSLGKMLLDEINTMKREQEKAAAQDESGTAIRPMK